MNNEQVLWIRKLATPWTGFIMPTLRDIAGYIDALPEGANQDAVIDAASSVVTHDSRRVTPGGVFVATPGARVDGNQFVAEAARLGAIAVVSEKPRPADLTAADSVVWMRVVDARRALAKAAALVHDHPSRKLALAGITGTNGKTTTAHLVESIFTAAGKKSAMMGTICYRIGDERVDADFTTPEASELQDFLRRAVEAGVTHAVMEVSSIALDMRRADGLHQLDAGPPGFSQFDGGLFRREAEAL